MDITPLRLPSPEACHLSIDNGTSASMVNYVPTSEEHMELPLIFEPGKAGEFEFSLKGLEFFKETGGFGLDFLFVSGHVCNGIL